MWWSAIAAMIYAITLSLGVTAMITKRRFGRWHHILFFLSVAGTLVALITEQQPLIAVPAIVLAAMPFTRAGSSWHAVIGTIGLAAWIVVLVLIR